MKLITDGLIIKETNIGENDKLVCVLTKSIGVVTAVFRGARSIKSGKCAPASLLSYSRLTLYKRRESYTIGDARALHIFSKLRTDFRKMCLAQYFCELAITVCPREQPAEDHLRLVLNALHVLGEGLRPELLVKSCLEMRLTAMAGYLPDLRMCRSCLSYEAEPMYFLPRSGNLECSSCMKLPPNDAVALDASALRALRHTVYADESRLFSFMLSEKGLRLLNECSERYLRCIFEKEFKTLDFYKSIT